VSEAVVYADNSTIPHIFFHTLVVDTSRAFDDNIAISKQDGMNKVKDYNYVMLQNHDLSCTRSSLHHQQTKQTASCLPEDKSADAS